MGYRETVNLHKDQRILLFKQVYATEKIHGTSAHVAFNMNEYPSVSFFSGGEKHSNFVALFDQVDLAAKFVAMGQPIVTVYGEAYGGKQQGMSHTYGNKLCFTAFEVKVGDLWLDVPTAERVVTRLGLEFVPYKLVDTSIESLEAARDADSEIAIRRGMGAGKKMEGVVLRPLIEVTANNGERIVAKFKRADFEERKTIKALDDPNKALILTQAADIAEEWVTPMRLEHVIGHLTLDGNEPGMERMKDIIVEMINDVHKEGKDEFEPSDAVNKAIGRKTAILMKARQNAKLKENNE